MKSLRILFVTRSLPFHGLGGMETVAWDLARAFAERGHTISVLTTACPALAPQSTIESVTIYCLDTPSGRYSAAWWRASRDFYRDHLRGRIDIVLSVSAGAMSMAAARDAADPALYLVQAHGTSWGEIVSKLSSFSIKNWAKALIAVRSIVADRGYRHFDAMITIGPRVTADVTKWPTRRILGSLPVDEIANGVDTTKFRFDPASRTRLRAGYGLAESTPVILALSRLHIQKGLQHSLRGFARARRANPALRFLVVGSGPHEQKLREIVRGLGLDDAVIFAGAIAREEVPAFYAAADAFIFTTTRIEGLPLNILEALSCGLPTIISTHIALAGQAHQRTVDPFDQEAVGAAILDAVSRPVAAERHCLLDQGYWLSTAVDRYLAVFAAQLRRRRAIIQTVLRPSPGPR